MFMSLILTQLLSFLALSSTLAFSYDAPASPQTSSSSSEVASDGVVVRHLSSNCDDHPFGNWQINYIPVDYCLATPTFSIEIRSAAVCANGTRAKWARFSDDKCGYGTISPTYGLADIADSDIMQCLVLGSSRDGPKVQSMAFWCDGVRNVLLSDNEPEERLDIATRISAPANVSESVCMPDGISLFNQPETDICVDLKSSRMKIYSAGVCLNGTYSSLALYKERGCVGSPADLRDIVKPDEESCMDLTGFSSFAFYCTGRGIETVPFKRPSDPCSLVQAAGIMRNLALAGLGTLQHCLETDLSDDAR